VRSFHLRGDPSFGRTATSAITILPAQKGHPVPRHAPTPTNPGGSGLSLGIQGISERTAGSKFFGIDIPGSNRASFLQYNFNAKLGLEGKDVKIERAGANLYHLSVPAFTFIGHDGVSFKMAAENNGVLSWTTPPIDPVETINQILNDEAKSQYVTANQQILIDQAKSFYTGIIRSVDPSAEVTFDFRN